MLVSRFTSYSAQVTPSMPGAADFFNASKLSNSIRSSIWCSNAVKRSVLLLRAASRTPSSPLDPRLTRLCVRREADCPVFPLAESLPSTDSADGSVPSLFAGFVGSMDSSDSPRTCASAVPPEALSDRSQRSKNVPWEDCGVSRFSRLEFPDLLRFYDSAVS